jgi:hypothetical protein
VTDKGSKRMTFHWFSPAGKVEMMKVAKSSENGEKSKDKKERSSDWDVGEKKTLSLHSPTKAVQIQEMKQQYGQWLYGKFFELWFAKNLLI